MENKDKKTENKLDYYLESAKKFHFEMPLYYKIDMSIVDNKTKTSILLASKSKIDIYCVNCEKESIFRNNKNFDNNGKSILYRTNDDVIEIEYICEREHHKYYIQYLRQGDFIIKIGQFPSIADFQIPQVKKYRKILGEDKYKEFTRGIGLFSCGIGIGSFVYLRRIFERLVEEAFDGEKNKENFSIDEFKKLRMDEKINKLKDCLPVFLVENRKLYKILSKGIHELSEKECLEYFDAVKIGVEQILDEKIFQKEKEEKKLKATEDIKKILGNLNK